jgi:hypothetical protein
MTGGACLTSTSQSNIAWPGWPRVHPGHECICVGNGAAFRFAVLDMANAHASDDVAHNKHGFTVPAGGVCAPVLKTDVFIDLSRSTRG